MNMERISRFCGGSRARKPLMDPSRSRRSLATAVKITEKARRGRLEGVERAIKELEPGEEAEEVKEIVGEGVE